jgi:NAD(P)-dependent dehydrogenase (short-subunit alcohol dehydrogenase family)
MTSKTALITGASRGLGLALARQLAQDGWTLVIDARGAGALETARAELAQQTQVIAPAGDITDAAHRQALADAAKTAGGLDALINNASILGPSPQPNLLDYPLDVLAKVYETNVIAPLALIQALRHHLKSGACVINVTSDAGVEPYEGWGGYGSSKAAFEQLSAILAAENPDWRVYWVDPGDMQTQMQQEAFPGEDISDRPLPESSVPGFISLLEGTLPSGRYRARNLTVEKPTVQEFRVSLTVDDIDGAAVLYRDTLGFALVNEWETAENGRGMILDAGKATLELLDRQHVEFIDKLEAGRRVSRAVRFAFHVADVSSTAQSLTDKGAHIVHAPVNTPWGDFNQRLQSPDGMQITLYEEPKAVNE